jgi:hypothetical protein
MNMKEEQMDELKKIINRPNMSIAVISEGHEQLLLISAIIKLFLSSPVSHSYIPEEDISTTLQVLGKIKELSQAGVEFVEAFVAANGHDPTKEEYYNYLMPSSSQTGN